MIRIPTAWGQISTLNWTWVAAPVLLWIFSLLWSVIYNLFFHPLRNVPGPFLAKVTTKWLSYKDRQGLKCATIHNLHQRYGPVVRSAPNELVFSNRSVVKQIYGFNSSYTKTPFYSGFEEQGRPVLFTLRDKAIHRDRRKLMSNAFSKTTIDSAEPLVYDQVGKFMEWLGSRETRTVNVLVWFRSLTLDIISSLYMGQAIGALDQETPHDYLQNVDDYFMIAGLKWQMPWLFYLASFVPLPKWQHFLKAQERLYEYGRVTFADYIRRYGRDSNRDDALKKLLQGDKDLPPLDDAQICCEVGSVLVAGTDTTATVLTYACWVLAKEKALQSRLRKELKHYDLEIGFQKVPHFKDVENLEYLNNVILESLRLYGPAIGGLPRLAPPEGAVIDGVKVPGGTTVSMQAYTLHHDEQIFPDPDAFLPERWKDGGSAEMKEASLQWSKGSRMCPGLFLATMELKVVIAALVSGWEMELGDKMQEDTMDLVDHWVLMPKGNFCDIKFRKISG